MADLISHNGKTLINLIKEMKKLIYNEENKYTKKENKNKNKKRNQLLGTLTTNNNNNNNHNNNHSNNNNNFTYESILHIITRNNSFVNEEIVDKSNPFYEYKKLSGKYIIIYHNLL